MPPNRSIGVRVRPNADNFIRLLKQEMATKQYTFWVDVRAKTSPATADVREWSNRTLRNIHAAISVGANTGQATRDVAEWRRTQRNINTVIPVTANMAPADREVAVWRKYAGRDLEIRVKATYAGRNIDGIRRQLGRDARVDIEADTSRLDRQMSDISDNQLELDLGVDTSRARDQVRQAKREIERDPVKVKAEADLADINRQMMALRVREMARKLKIDVEPEVDATSLRVQLAKLRLQERANKLEIDVDVKRQGLDDFLRSLRKIEDSMGGFSLIRSMDFGPLNLGKPTGLLGTLTTITALAGAMPGAVTGAAALSDSIMRLAGAASIVPGAIGGIVASLGTFSVATVGVSDAFEALLELWNEGPAEQATTARRAVQAQNQLRNAVVDEAKAQRDVANARREALGELRSLNNELRGSVLNEAQAILDAQKARDRYAQGLAEGFDTETDRVQGLLDIAKADQSIIDVRERNIALQQRVNQANADGVEGSDRVTDALEAQTRATQQAAEAVEAMASTQATGALGKFNDQLAQLSPNAQNFILTLAGMRGPLQGFRDDLQETLFQGLGPGVENVFNSLLPVIGPGMQSIAEAMNQNIVAVFDSVSSPDGQSIIERILGGTAQAQRALTGVVDPVVRGIGTLVAAGAEHLPQVVALIDRLATRFADFIQEADRSGALDKFMDEGIDAISNLAEIGVNAVQIINDFSNAFRSAFGEDLLSMIARVTGQWHEFLASDEGQAQLLGFIAEARDLWNDWRPILEDLPTLFGAASDAATTLINAITPFINLMTSTMREMPGLVEAFVGVWLGSKLISGFLSPVAKILTGVLKGFKALPGLAAAAANMDIPGILGGDGRKPGGRGPGVPPVAGAGVLAPIAVGVGAAATYPMVTAQEDADAAVTQQINDIGSKLPPGVPKPGTPEAEQAVASMAAQGNAVAKWVSDAQGDSGNAKRLDWAKRYAWMVANEKELDNPNFSPPPSYKAGGFTPWGQKEGKLAVLHGKEFIQPADTTEYYGVDAMEAMRQRKIPREFFSGFEDGGEVDPRDPRMYEPHGSAQLNASAPNPSGGGFMSAFQTGVQSGVGVLSNVTSQATSLLSGSLNQGAAGATGGVPGAGGVPVIGSVPGMGPAPGPVFAPGGVPGAGGAPVIGSVPGMGPTPGPAFTPSYGATPYAPTTGAVPGATAPSMNLFGFDIPLGGAPVGWPGGQAPIGLGGGPPGPNGEAPFDIRRFGIGPGPVGSTPSDWIGYTANLAGEFITGIGSTLLNGVLGFFGLDGLLSSPYANAAKGLAGHFLGSQGAGGGATIQAPGAAASNAQALAGLGLYGQMPTNPAYPGYAQMPSIYGADGSYLPTTGMTPTMGGEPPTYGLPAGTDTGGYGNETGETFPAWVHQVADAFGVKPSTYAGHQESNRFEPGYAPNPENQNRGIDWSGPPENMQRFADYVSSVPGMEQVIWNGEGVGTGKTVEIAGGAPQPGYFADDLGRHGNHVHTRQSKPIPPPIVMPDGTIVPGIIDPASMANIAANGVAPTGIPELDALNEAIAAPVGGPSTLSALGQVFSTSIGGAPSSAAGALPTAPGPSGTSSGSTSPFLGLGSLAPHPMQAPWMGVGPGQSIPGVAGKGDSSIPPSVKKWAPLFAKVLQKLGLPLEPWLTLGLKQMATESSGNPVAMNMSDSNAKKGTPSKGLMQVIDPTFRANLPKGFTPDPFNPESNIAASIIYTLGRYGGPVGVWGEGHGYDNGGWLMPGRTVADNATGKPELVVPYDDIPAFAQGGMMPTGAVVPPKPPPPLPRGPQVKQIQPKPQPQPTAKPPVQQAPAPTSKSPIQTPAPPVAPPVAHSGSGATPGPSGVDSQGPQGAAAATGSLVPPGPGSGSEWGMYLHPALEKGITSTAGALGNAAATAMQIGASILGAAGGAGASASFGGSLGASAGAAALGGLSGYVSGLFQQGGKVVVDAANVGASFLVGNITGGTTENAYGVTQRGNVPSGGAKIYDASTSIGSIQTADLDEYYRRENRRQAQRAQSGLGRWGAA